MLNDDDKAQLKAEFPGWSIIYSSAGRWWATRGPLGRGEEGRAGSVDADTPEGLRRESREADTPRASDWRMR
ncbi:hypothetical protein [Actinomadura litoris]|uniref:Uncharacterized protein n=1 Tax=Actinomadura litoris TaxID=2678616 RepID=A0A7K1KWG5_9ACTN|nr:hypothetical protein [Actinomadura litoris]MUN36538.1 hypothetical protein [Actinomadura litoris]